MRERVGEGVLGQGLPYRAIGDGLAEAVLRGLRGGNVNPAGLERWMELQPRDAWASSVTAHRELARFLAHDPLEPRS